MKLRYDLYTRQVNLKGQMNSRRGTFIPDGYTYAVSYSRTGVEVKMGLLRMRRITRSELWLA